MSREQVALTVHGVPLSIAVMRGGGAKTPIVFLHGFGSTKEDYADACIGAEFAGHEILAVRGGP